MCRYYTEALPNLTSLTIVSKRCNKDLLAMLQKTQAPNLVELHVVSVATNVIAENVFDLIVAAPKLTSLCVPPEIFMSVGTLQIFKGKIAALRGGGGSSLIRKLTMQNTTMYAVCLLGDIFPELEKVVLAPKSWIGHSEVISSPDPVQGNPYALPEVYLPPDNLSGMPRLHTFVHNYMSNHALCLAALFSKSPALKVLKLLRMELSDYQMGQLKSKRQMPVPLAKIPASILLSITSNLRELSLRWDSAS